MSPEEELARWKTGDWCDLCNAPQWVLADGSHECGTLDQLRDRLAGCRASLAVYERVTEGESKKSV